MRRAQPIRTRGHRRWAGWLLLGVVLEMAASSIQAAPAPFRELEPPVAAKPSSDSLKASEELGVGRWIWTTNFLEKQYCRLWRSFVIPSTNQVTEARLRITADNLYRLYLDGREIGEGGNLNSLTEYDLTMLLDPGVHVLAVEALNDSLEAGVLAGLRIKFANGEQLEVPSDSSWYVVPNDARRWQGRTYPEKNWEPAREVAVLGQTMRSGAPFRWLRPVSIIPTPAQRPLELHFWQTAWFLSIILGLCAVALALSVRLATRLAVQTRARQMLEIERARIARDIHDELGSGLTQLVLQGEVAQTEFPVGSTARLQLDQLCEQARAASHALDEVVWAVNSKRDTLRDFTSYLCKYAQTFLSSTPIRCRLDVQSDLPVIAFDLPVRRGMLLAVKEALNNAAKHSEATELFLRIYCEGNKDRVVVVVEDNGKGFDPEVLGGERNGILNMQQRLVEMGGEFQVLSVPGGGCRAEFKMPLAHPAERGRFSWRRLFGQQSKMDLPQT